MDPPFNGSLEVDLGVADTTPGTNSTGSSAAPREPSTEAIIICAILFVFSVLGVVGNAFAFLIYYRKRDKGTSTIFILSLAVTDFITCLIMIPFTIANELLVYKLTFEFFCKLFMFLNTHLILLSSNIMVAIGIDRYFCICHPFMRVVTVPRAKIILIVLIVISVAICVVPSLFYSVYQEVSRNVTITMSNATHMEVGLEDISSDSVTPPSNLSTWVASLSDAVLPATVNGGLFSYAASPPTAVSPAVGEQGSTASPQIEYTNGLLLNPDPLFLSAYQETSGPTVTTVQSPALALKTAAISTASALSLGGNASASLFGDEADDMTDNSTYTIVVTRKQRIYVGYCYQTFAILPLSYMNLYAKFIASIYLFEFVILALLYILIYRSILVRRAWKAKRRRMSGYASTVNGRAEETQLTHINAHVNAAAAGDGAADGTAGLNGNGGTDGQPSAETGLLNQKNKDATAGRVSAAMRDRAFYANIRTAAMLFVVTIVFVISYMPSWFMGLKYLKFNMIVFYMFYINNVINPFIYAFMNRAFRDDLVQLLKGCLRR